MPTFSAFLQEKRRAYEASQKGASVQNVMLKKPCCGPRQTKKGEGSGGSDKQKPQKPQKPSLAQDEDAVESGAGGERAVWPRDLPVLLGSSGRLQPDLKAMAPCNFGLCPPKAASPSKGQEEAPLYVEVLKDARTLQRSTSESGRDLAPQAPTRAEQELWDLYWAYRMKAVDLEVRVRSLEKDLHKAQRELAERTEKQKELTATLEALQAKQAAEEVGQSHAAAELDVEGDDEELERANASAEAMEEDQRGPPTSAPGPSPAAPAAGVADAEASPAGPAVEEKQEEVTATLEALQVGQSHTAAELDVEGDEEELERAGASAKAMEEDEAEDLFTTPEVEVKEKELTATLEADSDDEGWGSWTDQGKVREVIPVYNPFNEVKGGGKGQRGRKRQNDSSASKCRTKVPKVASSKVIVYVHFFTHLTDDEARRLLEQYTNVVSIRVTGGDAMVEVPSREEAKWLEENLDGNIPFGWSRAVRITLAEML